MQTQTADTIRQFILTRYLPGETADNLRDDTPLRSSGILDSLATLSLISFLEEQFKIEIPDEDTEQIKTVKDATNYIKTHAK